MHATFLADSSSFSCLLISPVIAAVQMSPSCRFTPTPLPYLSYHPVDPVFSSAAMPLWYIFLLDLFESLANHLD